MEAIAAALQAVRDWWASVPPIPDVDIPAPGDPDAMIVVSTVVFAVGMMGFVSGLVDKRISLAGIFALLLAAVLMLWVWENDREGFGWISIPEAFVEMVARIVR